MEIDIDFDKLGLRDGDILIYRTSRGASEVDRISAMLRTYIERQGLQNNMLVTLKPGESLRTVSEQEMRELGWVRAETLEPPASRWNKGFA